MKRPYDNITLRPPIPAKPEDGQRAMDDLGSIHLRTSKMLYLTLFGGWGISL
jgi:hypothetical protein